MRVGVILPARAPAPYLAEALDSVRSQEPVPDEIVVVDHASAPPLAEATMRLDDPAGGPAAARAAALRVLGDCDWVALADADDVWEPGKLAAQLDVLATLPDEVAVCFGRATVVDGRGRPTGERLPELAAGMHPAQALRGPMFARNAIPAASALIRREALESVGGFASGEPLVAGSDWELWLRLLAAGYAFMCVPAARIRYRRHEAGLTSSVALLAEAGLEIHKRHADLVDPDTARQAHASDLIVLAKGRIRERRYEEAREALNEAAQLSSLNSAEKALKTALSVPGVRAALGRRNPYG